MDSRLNTERSKSLDSYMITEGLNIETENKDSEYIGGGRSVNLQVSWKLEHTG